MTFRSVTLSGGPKDGTTIQVNDMEIGPIRYRLDDDTHAVYSAAGIFLYSEP